MSVSHLPPSRCFFSQSSHFLKFINSVLSSIGGGDQQNFVPPAQAQPGLTPKATQSNAIARPKIIANQLEGPNPGRKRKAEDTTPPPTTKLFKDEHGQKKPNSTAAGAGSLAAKQVMRPSISTSKTALAVPYRGTSRPGLTSASPSTPTADASKPMPKKGSYAEIMARAAANNTSSVGMIKHKPKEAISAKKEIQMRKKGLLPTVAGSMKHGRNPASGNDRKGLLPSSASLKGPGLPSQKAPRPSYKGTAAPKPKPQPAYKGTMKPKSSIADTARRKDPRSDRSRSNSLNSARRRRDYESEDDEDNDLDEDEVDLVGDDEEGIDSDDMEAGFSDVEEEETAATRAARKEDERELKLENQLKREKEERKRKLAAMAAKAAKPRF
ncbi:MAG: hypothetical protein Q9207_001334 [Kuettlingeria erythrocarpa]